MVARIRKIGTAASSTSLFAIDTSRKRNPPDAKRAIASVVPDRRPTVGGLPGKDSTDTARNRTGAALEWSHGTGSSGGEQSVATARGRAAVDETAHQIG